MKKLIEARQYVFGQIKEEQYQYNRRYEAEDYVLLVGRDTPVETIIETGKYIVLIGDIFDCNEPSKRNSDIAADIFNACNQIEECIDYCKGYGGRWVIIFRNSGGIHIFQDACGLRSVFYCGSKKKICSQYELFSKEEQGDVNSDAVEYIQTAKKKSEEYCWILAETPYSNIKRLLPNHYYSILQNKLTRFWPKAEYRDKEVEEAVKEAGFILKNSMEAFSNRYHLEISITAGLDTRMLLASALHIASTKFDMVTHVNHKTGKGETDLSVATIICEELNLNHRIIQYDSEVDASYKSSLEDKHELWHRIDYMMSRTMSDKDILIKGSCAEIARNSFGLLKNSSLTADILCNLYGIPATNWSVAVIDKWLKDTRLFCDKYGYKLIDLFYWEHRMGCWQAMCMNESDYYFETFTPFNNRKLIEVLLSVNEKKRIPPKYELYVKLINKLSDKCAEFPINPQYNGTFFRLKKQIKYKMPGIYLYLLKKRIRNGI